MPPIVAIASKLRGAALRFYFAGVGTYPKIPAAEQDFTAGPERFDFQVHAVIPVMPAGSAVDPVVQTPAQAIRPQLLIPLLKAGEQHFAHISFAISIGILEEKNIRR